MNCKLCGTEITQENLKAVEGSTNIYRCPGCSKPVIVNSGIVKPIATNLQS